MSSTPSTAFPITVIGDGLAGTLLALRLAERGATVRVIGAGEDTATALSYGSLPRGSASGAWRRLERRHGSLGWRPSALVFHDSRPGLPRHLAALTRSIPIPLAKVDTPTWMAGRAKALAAAGVRQHCARVRQLRPRSGGGWWLDLAASSEGETTLQADVVVLAAGAGSRVLWPSLSPQLRHSWAGVLLLDAPPRSNLWLDQARRGRIVQPRHWRRPALEASAAASQEPQWIVDAGMAPWGEGVVVGQISWIPPADPAADPALALVPPDPQWMEDRLRDELGRLDCDLATLPATYRQVPVSFCSNGQALVGPVADAPGLWAFVGFSAAFSKVPDAAEHLAGLILGRS